MEKILGVNCRKTKRPTATAIWTGVFVCVFFLFLLFPQKVKEGVSSGLNLCARGVIPSLFPFAVLSAFLIKVDFAKWVSRPFSFLSQALFRANGDVFALWLTGLVAGFPIGARSAAEMYRSGKLSKKEAEVAASFSNGPSPAFVIAFCGSFFTAPITGFLLFCILTFSSIICGALICRVFGMGKELRPKYHSSTGNPSALSSFTGACISGWESINTVCSFVIFFSVVISLGEHLLGSILQNSVLDALFRGFFELTAGISSLGKVGLPFYCKFIFAALILSFSGLCANMQVICFLKDAELDVFPYIVGRGLSVVVCTALSCVVGLLL